MSNVQMVSKGNKLGLYCRIPKNRTVVLQFEGLEPNIPTFVNECGLTVVEV
jgi:hypothetical protein